MSFSAEFTGTNSADGLSDEFTDTSPYATYGRSRSEFVRTFTFLNAYGDTIKTVVLGNSTNIATLDLTEDTWVNGTLTLVDSTTTYTKTYVFPTFYRIAKNLYKALLNSVGCNCGNQLYENALNTADRLFRGVDDAGLSGDGPGWQSLVDDANTILSQYPS